MDHFTGVPSGALHDATRPPGAIAAALLSRIKTLAKIKIVETRRPQEGQFVFEVDDRGVDVRVATIALVDGKTCGLRILDKAKTLLSLDELGMPATTLANYRELAHAHGGIMLAAGPTGSGKTTTLYATFGEILDPSLNVMTIEDPVEYVFTNFNQIQVNEPTGVDFYAGLRTILRLDLDLILVGEIRDRETAQVSVQAALSGHFVGSTIHARDASAALLLLGQPSLRARLHLGSFAALDQRVTLRYALPPMSSDETLSYVNHHLALCGRSDTLFSDDVLSNIHQVGLGLPRAVNNVARQTLVAAYANRSAIVDEKAVRQAITEMDAD